MTVMRKHKTTIQNCTGQQTIHTLNQVLIFLAIIKKSVCPIREMLKWEEVAQAGLLFSPALWSIQVDTFINRGLWSTVIRLSSQPEIGLPIVRYGAYLAHRNLPKIWPQMKKHILLPRFVFKFSENGIHWYAFWWNWRNSTRFLITLFAKHWTFQSVDSVFLYSLLE